MLSGLCLMTHNEATLPVVGPSSKIGNVKSSRKVDDTFFDDSDLTSIDPPSLPATLSLVETEGKESKSLPGVLPLWDPTLWSSFNSWTAPDPNAPAAPNGLTHHLWTAQIEAFRHRVEEHQLGFKHFIERHFTASRFLNFEIVTRGQRNGTGVVPLPGCEEAEPEDLTTCQFCGMHNAEATQEFS
ncbi:unnamed protein product [Cladocopium goreaui]|uniref:Uncharacterized protein n=1 Tax=Cladocopium goreaui TaxID=2562237 RepID=A0A9P1BPG3_9DINO|nr:unnamed protein product [Cladocopium goreaui]